MNADDIRILVVDDDVTVGRGTTRMLEQAGYITQLAKDGLAALLAMPTFRPQLVLSDRSMPVMDGLELCRRLKGDPNFADVLVILCSGTYQESDDRAEGLEAGADGYIVRPITNRELLARVAAFVRIFRLNRSLREQMQSLQEANTELRQSRLATLNLMDDAVTARDRLRDSEERFRATFELAAIGLGNLTLEGRWTWANGRLCQILGYPEEELAQLTSQDVVVSEDMPSLLGHRQMLLTGEVKSFGAEPRCRRRDGSIFWSSWTVTLVRDAAGAPQHFVVVVDDISVRKWTEDNMLRIRSGIESSGEAIVIAAPDGQHAYHNQAFARLFGYRTEELSHPQASLALYADPSQGRAVFDSILHGQSWQGEVAMVAKDGRRFPVELRADGIRDDRGQLIGLIGVHTDITERKQMEVELRESLREKVALLQEVHHRVKNNLQVVTSLLNLQAARSKDAELLATLRDTQNRVRSMSLLHEMLYRSENLAQVDFAQYARQLCTQISRGFGAATEHVQLCAEMPPLLLPLDQGVPCGLIVNELVTNALKHAFPDRRPGRIAVSLEPAESGQLVLCVSDNGVGLPAGLDVARLESLGLHLVESLAQQLKGKASIEGQGGTTVRITFPQPKVEA